eukprot:jgi/Botrbrau1/11190/Bobra.0214s0015.1
MYSRNMCAGSLRMPIQVVDLHHDQSWALPPNAMHARMGSANSCIDVRNIGPSKIFASFKRPIGLQSTCWGRGPGGLSL